MNLPVEGLRKEGNSLVQLVIRGGEALLAIGYMRIDAITVDMNKCFLNLHWGVELLLKLEAHHYACIVNDW